MSLDCSARAVKFPISPSLGCHQNIRANNGDLNIFGKAARTSPVRFAPAITVFAFLFHAAEPVRDVV